ncbi:hypothetical protein CK203_026719 [Vitis vinifera]|uniref:Reverse transcriptase domain-containing protein n=1 Tax=Vitis vinifera TaxID=29760 RepID=A0A438ITX4_VITVI|nr:hypothetical protein CK203_026719 [Vitis vinifera]
MGFRAQGIKVGDPLSPYLFVLAMEALTCLLRRANEGGLLTSFKANSRDGEGLEAISSLKINLSKSKLIPIGRVEDLEELAFEIGCKVGVLPTTYLGLPLGTHNNSLAVWDEEKGGLGVRRLHSLNKALLWGWCSKEVRGGYCIGPWKVIRKLWELVNCRMSFLASNGRRVKLQKDKWWRLNDWEIDIVQCFLTRLQDKVVVEGGQGKVGSVIREKGYRVKNLGRLKRGRARDVELLEDGRTMGIGS